MNHHVWQGPTPDSCNPFVKEADKSLSEKNLTTQVFFATGRISYD